MEAFNNDVSKQARRDRRTALAGSKASQCERSREVRAEKPLTALRVTPAQLDSSSSCSLPSLVAACLHKGCCLQKTVKE